MGASSEVRCRRRGIGSSGIERVDLDDPILKEVVSNRLWVAETPLRFYSVEVGTHMTACRLSDGGLWLHSPVRLMEELREDLDRLGEVRFVVCPNKLHHLFVGEYFSAYPGARFYASPGLAEKRRDPSFHGVLGNAPEPGWAEDLDQTVFRGERQLEEVAFLHRASRTLILADLVQSGHPDSPWLTRLATRLNGTYECPGPPAPVRLGFRDKAAAGASVERALSWDFDRMVVGHGRIIGTGGKAVFEHAYSFLSRPSRRTQSEREEEKGEERP